LLAASNGHERALSVLLRYGANLKAISRSRETILHCLLKNGARGNARECLEMLIKKEEWRKSLTAIVNKKDILQSTALHYATQMWPQEVVKEVLILGAHVGVRNKFEDIPISKIEPGTMEEFLNEHCLRGFGDAHDKNFQVTFDYSFLAPPLEELPKKAKEGLNTVDAAERQKDINEENDVEKPKLALPETQVLWFMGQSKAHRYLLKHPVVTSFLYLKWGRMKRDFNRNLRYYILFVYMLTWSIFEKFGGNPKGYDKNAPTLFFFQALFIALFIFIMVFIINDWIMERKQRTISQGQETSSLERVLTIVVDTWAEVATIAFMLIIIIFGNRLLVIEYAVVFLTILLFLREAMQLAVSLKRYVLSPENWLETAVIGLVAAIMYQQRGSEEEVQNSADLRKHLSAIAIVLSWAELITLIGKHPNLTRYNVYVIMFYKVLKTFFFFLIWYVFFILAFALGFYIILHGNPQTEDYRFFNNTWISLVKTSTMFVGELEFGDIPIDDNSPYQPLSYMFLLSFVFLIVVVLMNLLNGLAVSDTGVIKEKAETYSYISRVDTISYTEAILLGDPFNFLSNWPALHWIRDLPSCSFCAFLHKNKTTQKALQRMTGATDILLFYNQLPEKSWSLKPNADTDNCDCCQVFITTHLI